MTHQVRPTGCQTEAAEVRHMPTNSPAASGTFLKNRQQSHAAKVKKQQWHSALLLKECDEIIKPQ